MDKVSKILETIVVILIVVIGLFLLITLFPIKGNYQIKIVLSGSMEPAIKTGSIVIMKPSATYSTGDIVTFGKDTKKDVPTTHRIVSSRAVEGVMLYTTKGDANNSPDTTEIRLSNIHGKVLFSIPYMGYIIDFVKKPLGMVVVIVIPAIYIVYDEISKIISEIKRMRKSKLSAEEVKEEKNES
jgi:signal peptidase